LGAIQHITMSQLKNAPLLEVIFEVRWKSDTPEDLANFEMMLGSIFSELKSDYPSILHLRPDPQLPLNIFINQPTHRFFESETKKYPLYQLGPGVLSINTINLVYDWDDFYLIIKKILLVFLVKSNFNNDKELEVSLKYIDLYRLPDIAYNYLDFLKSKFNINLEFGPAIPEGASPILANFETAYLTEVGTLSFSLKKAHANSHGNSIEAIIFESGIMKKTKLESFMDNFEDWIELTHSHLRDFFRNVTRGKTYESFK